MTPALVHRQLSVKEIIHDYHSGWLVVPEFQREYVWKPSRAPQLVDSLYHQFPISSLLVWESTERVEVRRAAPAKAAGGSIGWLIDGQQRVITLARAFAGDEGIDVLFNIEDEQFNRATDSANTNEKLVRVSDVWDDEWYRRYRRNLPDDIAGRNIEARLERLRGVLDYKIPIVRMIGYDFQDAMKAFQRINTLGVKLRTEDLQIAQIAENHSGFVRKQMMPFLRNLHKQGFDRITATHLFRACEFAAQSSDRSRGSIHQLGPKDLQQAWKRTETAVDDAINLCANELGIADMSIFWSANLLLPVIAVCGILQGRERKTQEIAGWVALAALTGRYGGSSNTALEQDLKACEAADPIAALLANLHRTRSSLQATPADFNAPSLDKSKLLALWIAVRQLGAEDLFTQQKFHSEYPVGLHHILPRAAFQPGAQRQSADNIANIAFVSKDTNQTVGNKPSYLERIPAAALKSQGIPANKALWNVTKADELWKERREILSAAFNSFLAGSIDTRRLKA